MGRMIIAHVVAPDASQYERKSQRIDAAALAASGHTITGDPDSAEIVHVYAGPALPRLDFRKPFVTNVAQKKRRFSFRRGAEPRAIVTPFNVPEAVEDAYFAPHSADGRRPDEGPSTIGSYLRPSVENLIQQTMSRIDRFRSDVEWRVFTHPPSPQDVASVALWADPAVDENDYDGFVAEALAAGTIAVAARTPVNVARLDKGHAGLLVVSGDPNEWTHAILTALFKPERSRIWSEGARQTVARFRTKQRLRALTQLYESILR